ncbi:exonuclease V subunit beta [Ceratobasidium sp. AG-Ba]|nr:exonuclease V subunit beta [Ceratobasidium sp. AG-Ba]
MSLDLDTPLGPYAKVTYCVRIVAWVPHFVDESTMREKDFKTQALPQRNFKMYGTAMCALDVVMAHGAAMYAAGRLMDNIRNPFNASVIRAEMDALRDRNHVVVSPEDIKRWREFALEKEVEQVKLETYDPEDTRSMLPPCPYLFQLAWKSFYIGNSPPYWCGAREFDLDTHNTPPPLHAIGRAGTDSFRTSSEWDPTCFLYIDV